MLQIHVPDTLHLKEGKARPFYCTKELGHVDLVDLSILTPEQTQVSGSRIQIMSEYKDQPVLIVTTEGPYLIQSDPLRLNNAPLVAVESMILGVYPLYCLVEYKRPFDKEILNKLRRLILKKKSIFELNCFDD